MQPYNAVVLSFCPKHAPGAHLGLGTEERMSETDAGSDRSPTTSRTTISVEANVTVRRR